MKIAIKVMPRDAIRHPESEEILKTLRLMGYTDFVGLKKGKYFEVEVTGDENAAEQKLRMERTAKKVLADPIVEDFKVEVVPTERTRALQTEMRCAGA